MTKRTDAKALVPSKAAILVGGVALALAVGAATLAALPRAAVADEMVSSDAGRIARGGRLYDKWYAVIKAEKPADTHPAWPASNTKKKGDTTWRCKSCHGWDYMGKDGAYATGSYQTGIPGIRSFAGADPAKIVAVLQNPQHALAGKMSAGDFEDLALFVSKGQVDALGVIDPATGAVRGDAARGRAIFQNVCAICHDYDGKAWITGDEDQLTNLGAIASRDPWRGLHKVMNGQTYADMPAMRAFGLETVLDVLAYAQSLPSE